MIILKLVENVNFLIFEFYCRYWFFYHFIVYFLLGRDISWEVDPAVNISFIYEYLNDVGLFLLYQILFYLINRFVLLIYGIAHLQCKWKKALSSLFSNRADLNGYLQLTGVFPLPLLLADVIITWYFY